ncbi:MAG TPA: nucleotidyltransferase family protein [Jatrophihabitantaceae bacterium]|jgi:hypothetical protein|nr:nucleotidyltransferase family protein [Jatrophihabitantaceae bacterium]
MAHAQQQAHAALVALMPRLRPWTSTVLFAPYRAALDLPELSADEFDDIIGARLGPLLLDYVRAHDADIPAELAEFLPIHQAMGELRIEALVREAEQAARIFTANGIEFAVSKGPGIAAHYPHRRLRPFGDIDFLLPERDFARAFGLLEQAGWQADLARREQRDYFIRRCREAVNLEHGDLGRIDLHHHVPPWLWGLALPTEDLVGRSAQGTSCGVNLPVLDAVDNFLISCLHIVSDRSEPGRSLIVWRDIVELGRVIDVAEMTARAEAAGLAGWVGAVLTSLPADVRPFDVPQSWLTAEIGYPRRVLALLNGGAEGHPIKRHLARLPAFPNGVLYAVGVTFPDSEFLAAHVHGSMKLLRWITNKRGT